MGEYSELSCAELLKIAIPITELEMALYAALKKAVGKIKFDPMIIALPPVVDFDNWTRWCEYRKSKRKPVSERAAKEQLTLLSLYTVQLQMQMVTNSIMNDYQGLFPVKEAGNGTHQPATRQTFADRTRDQALRVINGEISSPVMGANGRPVRR